MKIPLDGRYMALSKIQTKINYTFFLTAHYNVVMPKYTWKKFFGNFFLKVFNCYKNEWLLYKARTVVSVAVLFEYHWYYNILFLYFSLHLCHGFMALCHAVFLCGSVVEHCVSSAKGCGFDSQGTHILIKNVYSECNCKSLWIKASAKCVNVNVHCFKFRFQVIFIWFYLGNASFFKQHLF